MGKKTRKMSQSSLRAAEQEEWKRQEQARLAAVANHQAKAKADAAKAAATTEAITHACILGIRGKYAESFVDQAVEVATADATTVAIAQAHMQGLKGKHAARFVEQAVRKKTKGHVLKKSARPPLQRAILPTRAKRSLCSRRQITASHSLQLQFAQLQQTPLVDFNFASEPVSSTQLVDNELADITFDTAPHDIPRDVWELF